MADLDQKQMELDLFHKWRQTGDPKHFQDLYTSMKPMLHAAAKKASFGSNLPEVAFRLYTAQNFLDALKTYRPEAGALQTHVFGAVHQKAKRLNYMYQNLGHTPEPRAAQIGLYLTEHANMKGELGRDPSHAELAQRLGMSVGAVTHLQKEVHADLAIAEGTEETPFAEGNVDEQVLDFLYYDLTGEEKAVYDLVLGKHGHPKMTKPSGKIDYAKIGMALGYSASKARVVWNRVRAKYEKAAKK